MLAYVEKGRLAKTACLHQYWLCTGKNAMETSAVFKVDFGE
jgi:hypothetical protein